MRRLTILASLGLIVIGVAGVGCRREPLHPDPAVPAVTTEKPTVPQLVAYLNDNAHLMQSMKSTQVQIDAKQGNDAIGLEGTLFCQKQRNFRLRAKALGQPAVDIGSNDEEFWFWISQAKDDDNVARVHYCSYKDMASGKARMPFPFQPDMIVAALGIGEYDPNKDYTLKEDAKTLSLVEQAVSAQGQQVQKVTVFNKVRVGPGKPQVLAYLLLDANTGAEVRATVLEVQTVQIDRDRTAVLPQKVQLVWKPQQIEMTMRLFDTKANGIDAAQAAKLFSRADLASIPSANLAQASDTPSGYSQETGIQPARLNAPVK